MNTNNYLLCAESFGLSGGSIIASYNFNNQKDSVVFNDLYPTGECYSSSLPVTGFYLDKHNLAILKDGNDLNTNISGNFSGREYAYILTDKNLEEFSLLIDFSFNTCAADFNQTLVVTNSGNSLNSGMLLGINQANRLFLEYGTGLNKRIHTCDFNISKNNVVNLTVAKNGFRVSRYHPLENIVLENFFPSENQIYSKDIFLFKPFKEYSGFSGKANHIFLSESVRDFADLNYFNCSFCSGASVGVQESQLATTGFTYESYSGIPVFETQITGYEYAYFYDPVIKDNVIISSGITGQVEVDFTITGEQEVSTQTIQTPFSIIGFDEDKRESYMDKITINFINPLQSGDLLEIYDYQYDNQNINLNVENLTQNKNIALFSNGMLLVSGLDYDVQFLQIIDSFDDSDELRFNYLEKETRTLFYSGLHDAYKQATGTGEGTGYFPSKSQFYESGDGNVTITGLTGLFQSAFSLSDYDLFMNGQKIYTGIDYGTGVYNGKESLVIYANNFNDAKLQITTGVSGELISIDSSTESVLSFCPMQTGVIFKSLNFLTSGVSLKTISGKNEEIWLNGIKLINNINYSKILPCSSYSYNFNIEDLPYIFCNENDVFFNID